MPRISREVKALGEAHRKTMSGCPNFNIWVRKFLNCRDRLDDYEKAYNYVHKGGEDEQTISGPRPFNED